MGTAAAVPAVDPVVVREVPAAEAVPVWGGADPISGALAGAVATSKSSSRPN